MPESGAVNASPLIFLSRIGRLDLLQLVDEQIAVPLAVANEIQQYGPADPVAREIAAKDWLITVESEPIDPLIRAWDLGSGEEAVLQWAYSRPNCTAIIDDLAARRCAATLGIRTIGTLGLVLIAKRRGLIAKARPVVEHLRRLGMYLSDHVIDQALKRVDE